MGAVPVYGPALALLAAIAPAQRASFLFAYDGVLSGQVTLSLSEDRRKFVYRSEHIYGRGGTGHMVEEHAVDLDPPGVVAGSSRLPVSLWLWRMPGIGCVEVEDERTRKRGQGCVERVADDVVEGMALDQPFRATYRSGLLQALELGKARFTRAVRPLRADIPATTWDHGFAAPGGSGWLTLAPEASLPPPAAEPGPKARAWALKLLRDFGVVPDSEQCLEVARRFIKWTGKQNVRSELVLGVMVTGSRAWPHAWTRLSAENGERVDVDPTWGRLASATNSLALGLAVPDEPALDAGQLYLDLLSGARKIIRRR
jgi:hypothetical protein